jgi:hypothetical protein
MQRFTCLQSESLANDLESGSKIHRAFLPASLGFLLLPLAIGGQSLKSVILPSSEVKEISQLCSRNSPIIEGSWNPSVEDVYAMEARLANIEKLPSGKMWRGRIQHPEQFFRQYVGVIVNGHRAIYINAFPSGTTYWHSHLVSVCDGGASFWGVLYDVGTRTFSQLEVNGVA